MNYYFAAYSNFMSWVIFFVGDICKKEKKAATPLNFLTDN